MSSVNKTTLLFLLLTLSVSISATEKVKEVTLKNVMQGLLTDTTVMTQGIFLEDFNMIERAASKIADHPKPAMALRMKLMKNLGSEMKNFKGFDSIVHNTAVSIKKAATEKNMPLVVAGYHQLIDGCQSCHSNFKQRVTEILK